MCKINILIADDSNDKLRHVRRFLDEKKEIVTYNIVQDSNNCKRELESTHYDILLLDLKLPLRAGDSACSDEALNILKLLKTSQRLNRPVHVILFTSFVEELEIIHDELGQYACEIICFKFNENDWEDKLARCFDHCIKFKICYCASKIENSNFDVALITALANPELEQVLELGEFVEFNIPHDSTVYYKAIFKTNRGENLNIVAASSNQMGMVAATDLTNKILYNFKPKIVIMCGIAAGFSGNFGDILIASSCDDYGNGKLESKRKRIDKKILVVEEFKPDPNQVQINGDLKNPISQLKRKRTYLDEISDSFNGTKPENPLNVIFGPFASGAGVIASKRFIDERLKKNARKLIGIDMEAYGVYYACYYGINPKPKFFLSIKSLSDKGDNLKNDKFQKYASYTSAQYAYSLLTESSLFDGE